MTTVMRHLRRSRDLAPEARYQAVGNCHWVSQAYGNDRASIELVRVNKHMDTAPMAGFDEGRGLNRA